MPRISPARRRLDDANFVVDFKIYNADSGPDVAELLVFFFVGT
jgi:hypothetical protein